MSGVELGNFIKIDMFGHISVCVHGRIVYDHAQTQACYPSMQVRMNFCGRFSVFLDEVVVLFCQQIMEREIGKSKRFYMFNTLFELVDCCLFADVVALLVRFSKQCSRIPTS